MFKVHDAYKKMKTYRSDSKGSGPLMKNEFIVVITAVGRLTAGMVLHIDVTKKNINPSRNKRFESPPLAREYLPRINVVNMRMIKSNPMAAPMQDIIYFFEKHE